MPKKTKMILRNDPAKNRKNHCDGCGEEVDFNPINPEPIWKDMHDFIGKQEHWTVHPTPTICWGMLEAVMDVVFEVAPDKEKALEVITDVTKTFIDADA